MTSTRTSKGVIWAQPENSKNQIDRAGRVLAAPDADPGDRDAALSVLDNWRAAHAFPLNTIQILLRRRARSIYASALTAQRLKRAPSIIAKLQRFDSMSLARMQDIGGCRAVLRTVRDVKRLRELYETRAEDGGHQLVRAKDYLAEPQDTGYRGIHLVYKFASTAPKSQPWVGLQVEIQLRSRLQHAWATAVETVGTFLTQALKSRRGDAEWLRYFRLVSAVFAQAEETPIGPGVPQDPEMIFMELAELSVKLDARTKLQGWGKALQQTDEPKYEGSRYLLLSLSPRDRRLRIFSFDELPDATAAYVNLERQLTLPEVNADLDTETVLVGADSLKNLKRAYPNYFVDTEVFLAEVDTALLEWSRTHSG